MHLDVLIIGAGLSGLAAGVRLAYFGKRVCIAERHYAYGGLNSHYLLNKRRFDVGLHAVTNYVGPKNRNTPLNRLLRQLRIPREEWDLREQFRSRIVFPRQSLTFSNNSQEIIESVAHCFPRSADRFADLVRELTMFEGPMEATPFVSARRSLQDRLGDAQLCEMLLCPTMLYGNPREQDMDWIDFGVIFRAIICEGFARPRQGILPILTSLVRRFRANGGKLRMRSGVRRLSIKADRVQEILLDDGEQITADVVLSCAGHAETLALCEPSPIARQDVTPGAISFVESIAVLQEKPAELGLSDTVIFFSDHDEYRYQRPQGDVDFSGGVIACPNNYDGHEHLPEGLVRLTWLANPQPWFAMTPQVYAARKTELSDDVFRRLEQYAPNIRSKTVFLDMFTPCTIHRFTGKRNGAVYGAPMKQRSGATPISNLWLCGSDQGFLGIIGSMSSGVAVANRCVLSENSGA